MSLLFGANNTQNQSSTTGSLFGNINTNAAGGSLFGNKTDNNKQESLFGNMFGNSTLNNTNNQTTTDKSPSLFGNNKDTNKNLFGANNTANTNTQSNTNNNLFGNINNSVPGKIGFGIFQNNSTSNNENQKGPNNSLFNQSVQNSQAQNTQGNFGGNAFSLLNQNNTNTQEKPKEKNDNQNKPNVFLNAQAGNNNNLSVPSTFGVPQQEKKPEIKLTNDQPQSQTQNQNQNQTQDKPKEESKPQSTLFGNNINNQPGLGSGNLFGNNNSKDNETQNKKPEINLNPNQSTNPLGNINTGINAVPNQNPQNQNNNINPNPNPNQVDNTANKNGLNIKIPEKPFEFSFSNSKELEEYEKNQMLHKTNKEIVEEFKNMLLNQKAKYKQCMNNTRKFEQKLMGIIDITKSNALLSKINQSNGKKIIEKINSLTYLSKNLENIITNFNEKLSQTLSPYKDNVMNSDKILLNQNNSEKFKFYENFAQISDKCYAIENALNEAEQNLQKKEKEMENKSKDQYKGVWIERNKGKIYVNQNEMNNLFSECYDGLVNLKKMQDTIDKRYDMLKLKLMKNTGNGYMNKINNNIYNFNDTY